MTVLFIVSRPIAGGLHADPLGDAESRRRRLVINHGPVRLRRPDRLDARVLTSSSGSRENVLEERDRRPPARNSHSGRIRREADCGTRRDFAADLTAQEAAEFALVLLRPRLARGNGMSPRVAATAHGTDTADEEARRGVSRGQEVRRRRRRRWRW